MRMCKKALLVVLCLIMVFGTVADGGKLVVKASDESQKITEYSIGDIIEFGSYPQTDVTSFLGSVLNSRATNWKSYNYYSGRGKKNDGQMTSSDYMQYCDITYGNSKYRGVTFSQYRPYFTGYTSSSSNSYQSRNGYTTDNIYWFKYEPLKWRVLDPENGFLLSEDIIDGQPFNNYMNYVDNGFYGSPTKDYYPNNYAKCSLRQWLTDETEQSSFLNTAFSDVEQNAIQITALDNRAREDKPEYDSITTYDKVYILSYYDINNEAYDLSSAEKRYAIGSDYAKCQGLSESTYTHGNRKTSEWSLRTAVFYDYTFGVQVDGLINQTFYTEFVQGVRPAINLSPSTIVPKYKDANIYSASTYGLCIMNNRFGVGCPANYHYSKSLVRSLFNSSYQSWDEYRTRWKSFTPDDGSCMGMAVLSAFQFYGKHDFGSSFSHKEEYLNDCYDNSLLFMKVDGVEYHAYSYKQDSDAVNFIERAMILQDYIVRDTRMFEPASIAETYNNFINYVQTNGANSKPIVIVVSYPKGILSSSSHAIVLDPSIPMKKDGNVYTFYVYDLNYPKSNNPESLNLPYCYNTTSTFTIDMSTLKWKLTGDENWQKNKVGFYDVSKIDYNYFYEKHGYSLNINKWVLIAGNNATIKSEGKKLFEIKDGEITYLPDNLDYYPMGYGNNDFIAYIGIGNRSSISVSNAPNTRIKIEGDNKLASCMVSDNSSFELSLEEMSINSAKNTQYDISLGNGTETNSNGIAITGVSSKNDVLSFKLHDNDVELNSNSDNSISVETLINEKIENGSFIMNNSIKTSIDKINEMNNSTEQPTDLSKVRITAPSGKKQINWKYKAQLVASAVDLPSDLHLAWYEGDKIVCDNAEFITDNLTSNHTYTIKIIDKNKKVVSDASQEKTVEVDVKDDFFTKIISFFSRLFGGDIIKL